ncbi:MAG: hypothetical protein ACL93V_00275 [Candidatus Electrothrix sp. YB6]
MGDMRIAKLILSKILDQEIETLEFKPTEFRKKIGLNLTGHPLQHTESPVVKVQRSYIDAVTQEELEILLSIFDQSQQTPNNRHFLDLNEETYPEEFRIVIRRLLKAAVEEDICETMDLEDDILDELESLERAVLKKEKIIEEQSKVLAEKDKALSKAIQTLVDSGMTESEAKSRLGLPS